MKLRSLAAFAALLLAGSFFTAGAAVAQDVTSEKGKLSYAIGYKTGMDLAELIANGEGVDVNTVIKAMQDAVAKKQPAVPAQQLGASIEAMQKRMSAKAKAEFDKLAADNKAKSNSFLAQNKGKAGVKLLPSGVQYRVIEAGAGAKPVQASTVELDVAGPFPLGNRPQTAQAPTRVPSMKVSEIEMAAMREALLQMPTGAKWEITLPPEKAYGADPRTGFPPNLAVQFEVKLISIKK